ncbi:MAG TPA: hypothetical protein VGN83_28095 [Falsiroseomonas sp.]|jgi:hypothetical protein|nr:hypothetical protein [Falsiroseomonas sp.]
MVSGFLKRKAEKHLTDEREVRDLLDKNMATKLPSWMGNSGEVETFYAVVDQMAKRKGIPALYVRELLKLPEAKECLLNLAGEMEARGHSRAGQQLSAVNFIIESYHRLSAADQVKISMVQLDENMRS